VKGRKEREKLRKEKETERDLLRVVDVTMRLFLKGSESHSEAGRAWLFDQFSCRSTRKDDFQLKTLAVLMRSVVPEEKTAHKSLPANPLNSSNACPKVQQQVPGRQLLVYLL
jgi:hypothetical protein